MNTPTLVRPEEITNGSFDYLLNAPLEDLIERSSSMRDQAHGEIITYSKKVFIPLTQLCRNVCHYCTFANSMEHLKTPFLSPESILKIARAGKRRGCKEALFTLGDKPELRYKSAEKALREMGYTTTVEYLRDMAALVKEEVGLLPHINCGLLTPDELLMLRTVAPSMGLMLESSSSRLCTKGNAHYGSPDKKPELRLECLQNAGQLKIPFTSGILVGIGETRKERLDSLQDLLELHQQYGHIQEVIIQNFVPKEGTKMEGYKRASTEELIWTIACARIIFGSSMSIQTPPNLNLNNLDLILKAGINDWGGISPVTPDYVNPESHWPNIEHLSTITASMGKVLVERLTIYPKYIQQREQWLHKTNFRSVLALSDASSLARTDAWAAGKSDTSPNLTHDFQIKNTSILGKLTDKALTGRSLSQEEIVKLFSVRGQEDLNTLFNLSNALRKEQNGDVLTYVLNANINYTNICSHKCAFCSFSRKSHRETNLDRSYLLDIETIVQKAIDAANQGATEVCLQGGIHPNYTGQTYLDICKAIRDAVPHMHIHAFSPVEINHGAKTLGISIEEFLTELQRLGLNSLPGTAAEILNDGIRKKLSCNKISTNQWIATLRTAHQLDLSTTSTIMFGHLEDVAHWAEHLTLIRRLQKEGGKITEFVPLPFVHFKAPIFLKGAARPGPTFREALLMHAVSRLVLYPYINNIQVSWPKLGLNGALKCLQVGANDFGGSLRHESISRAAGAMHGQYVSKRDFQRLAVELNRVPRQRNSTYDLLE